MLYRSWISFALLSIALLMVISCGGGSSSSGSDPQVLSSNLPSNAGGTTSLTFSWIDPQTREDKSPLNAATDIRTYRIYFRTSPGAYQFSQDFAGQDANGQGTTTGTVTTLQAGTTYYFAITAIDTLGQESAYSTEVEKTVS